MPPPDTDLAARVRAGMAFLDERLGAGWEEPIDLETLNLDDCLSCTLGQLDRAGRFGAPDSNRVPNFFRVIDLLDWSYDRAVAHGFVADLTDTRDAAAALTAEWRAQLAARRAGKETIA